MQKSKLNILISFGILRESDYEYPYHCGALNYEEYFMALDELILALNLKLTDIGEKSISLKKHSKDMILNNNEMIGLIDYYSKILLDHSHNDKMIVMDGDLMKDHGLTKFKKLHPSKFIECGISEQDMVSQAGAFALENFIPIVHSFGSFLSTRANEQIYNNDTFIDHIKNTLDTSHTYIPNTSYAIKKPKKAFFDISHSILKYDDSIYRSFNGGLA